MSVEKFKEVNRYRPHRERAYAGMPFEAIPRGLRERVRAAVKFAAGIDSFAPEIKCSPEGILWQFGEYTDVFVFDGVFFNRGYHRQPDGIIYTTHMSTARYEDHAPIAEALGLDRNKAEIIPGFGWAHGQDVERTLREYLPQGPYYGMRIETPE